MLHPDTHLPEEELLMAIDGELPARRADQVRAHLEHCQKCRTRMAEFETAMAEFTNAYRQALDPQLPPITGPRALLRARLAEMSTRQQVSFWRTLFHFKAATRRAAFLCVATLIVAMASGLLVQHSRLHEGAAVERAAVPNRGLTPGATRNVTVSDVCSMSHEEVVAEVSTSLRQEVFHEYGIANARAGDYEIDYLIAPGLGGAEDIHNLWPQPYTSRIWNAHVKDTLEEHLHQMVCEGKLDLSKAQRDIATDWIAAYKTYFHTDRPLSQRSRRKSVIVGDQASLALKG